MAGMDAQALIDGLKALDDTTAVLVITTLLQEKPELAPPVVTFAVPDLTYPPTKVLTERRCKGSIKTFNAEKNFGLIECEELNQIFGSDVFLHGKQCPIHHPPGTQVSFSVLLSKDNQPQAYDVIKEASQPMPGMAAIQGLPGMQAMQGAMGAMGGMGMGMPGVQGMPGMGMAGVAGMTGMPAMSSQGAMMGGNAAAMMQQMMAGKGASKGGPGTLGHFNGTIRSFDPKQGCGFINCPDVQAQGYSSDVFLSPEELGAFEVGSQVSFTAFLNSKGQPEARDLQSGR